MISTKMGTSFFDTVPEMSEFDFDLGTMDTFEDLDINMTGLDMMGDSGQDPFGDFNLEQSFNLIELNKVFANVHTQRVEPSCSSSESEAVLELEEFEEQETLKQDIMWSSAHNIHPNPPNSSHNSHSRLVRIDVLNVKALVGAFNQEKALVGAFSVIVKTGCGIDGTLHSNS